MIEDLLKELIATQKEQTAALKENTAALLGKSEPAAPAKKSKPTPAPAPIAALPDPEPEEVTDLTPTKVAVTKSVDDTPNVPASAPPSPGQPVAAEHVDVDEVLAQINSIVKGKLVAGDTALKKAQWEKIRKDKYGVDRISELKSQPAKLLAALADAKAL